MNLETEPDLAVQLCIAAQERLEQSLVSLDDTAVRAPSLLPNWSRAHVLTHLARNADAHARRIGGALEGKDLAKYAGGGAQRAADIQEGSTRDVDALRADVVASQKRLTELMHQARDAGWPNARFMGGSQYAVISCPAHRLREVEMHHVDLGVGYAPSQWSPEYVTWETETLLPTLAERMTDLKDRQSFLAWMAGRGSADSGWKLMPWG